MFPTGNSFLAGFVGKDGTDVDALGVVLFKPIKSATITNLTYPTIASYEGGIVPNVYTDDFTNSSDVTQSNSYTYT